MTYQDDEFILVGNFGRPIGLKGSLKLNSFTRPADNIKKYSSFFFKKEDSFISLPHRAITQHGLSYQPDECFLDPTGYADITTAYATPL